jgi:hypothetical protein
MTLTAAGQIRAQSEMLAVRFRNPAEKPNDKP